MIRLKVNGPPAKQAADADRAMSISSRRHTLANQSAAGEARLCKVFSMRAEELFWPAYVLTGSLESSERCFVEAIDATATQMPSEETYVYRVARRFVIKAAICSLGQEIQNYAAAEASRERDDLQWNGPSWRRTGVSSTSIAEAFLEPLWALNPFRRSALVLRSFERWHRKDAALLLGVSMSLIEIANRRGLAEFLGRLGNDHAARQNEAWSAQALVRSA